MGFLLLFEYFSGGGFDSEGIRELSVGVSSRVLTSLSSLSLEVLLHRYLTLATSL